MADYDKLLQIPRGTKARLETIKLDLLPNTLVFATDTKELGVKLSNGNIEYFKNTTDINTIVNNLEVSKQDKLIAGANITIDPTTNVISASGGGNGGGGITKKTVNIPFTEVLTQTPTTIEVQYSYVGDDPINFTADFSNFTFGGDLTLDMGEGAIPPSMAVQAVFGKTTLNYFEIIILFRYLIEAALEGAIVGEGTINRTLLGITFDYMGVLEEDTFGGISDVNINGATFTVDFMTQCQDIPLFNTVTGRGSNMSVEVDTVGGLNEFSLLFGGVPSEYFNQVWSSLQSGYTLYHNQHIGGMTLKFVPNIKMKPNYNGVSFVE